MKIHSKNIGEHRWLAWVYTDNAMETAKFKEWCAQYKDTLWVKDVTHTASFDWVAAGAILEVRSRDHKLKTLLAMIWAG